MQELRPGLVLRCSTSRHGHGKGLHSNANAGLHLVVVLQGQVRVSYAGHPLELGDGLGSNMALTALAEPTAFSRIDESDGDERKLALEMAPEWLRQSELPCPRPHLQAWCCRAGRRVRRLADALMSVSAAPAGLDKLRRECLTLELLTEVFSLEQSAPLVRSEADMHRARELLDSGAADRWSLSDIALELGLHENTLQRRFREAIGCSVFDYLRQQRLDRARNLLIGGISVMEAALEVGYDNPANFATAFKRQFGLSPSLVRPENQ